MISVRLLIYHVLLIKIHGSVVAIYQYTHQNIYQLILKYERGNYILQAQRV